MGGVPTTHFFRENSEFLVCLQLTKNLQILQLQYSHPAVIITTPLKTIHSIKITFMSNM